MTSLKVRPLSITQNFLPLSSLMTWPDTNGLSVKFAQQNGALTYIIESAAIVVADDFETAAICEELSKKRGLVPITVQGPDTDEEVLVYNCFDHSEGKRILMCIGREKSWAESDIFTQQIWPPE